MMTNEVGRDKIIHRCFNRALHSKASAVILCTFASMVLTFVAPELREMLHLRASVLKAFFEKEIPAQLVEFSSEKFIW